MSDLSLENDEGYQATILELSTIIARLQRILAVERGDESQAREGWWWRYGYWTHTSEACRATRDPVSVSGVVSWSLYSGSTLHREWLGTYPTAIEAMEAADAALATP